MTTKKLPEMQPEQTIETKTEDSGVSYFDQRITKELGITDEQNRIRLKFHDLESNIDREVEYKIFTEDEAGNIRITPFTLNRELIQYDSQKATPTIRNIENSRTKVFYITRVKDPKPYIDKNGNEKVAKYLFPKGAETTHFINPGLCQKWERKEKI